MGSHVAKQFLEYGYKVRGTVRDTTKFSWLLDLFQKDYGKDSFELVQVDNLAAKGAFDETVKGKFNKNYHYKSVIKLIFVLKRSFCGHSYRLNHVV